MTTAQLIRAMRKHAGLTQAELADLLGLNQASTVSTLESGHRRPNTSTDTIMRVAKACGVGMEWTATGGWRILIYVGTSITGSPRRNS